MKLSRLSSRHAWAALCPSDCNFVPQIQSHQETQAHWVSSSTSALKGRHSGHTYFITQIGFRDHKFLICMFPLAPTTPLEPHFSQCSGCHTCLVSEADNMPQVLQPGLPNLNQPRPPLLFSSALPLLLSFPATLKSPPCDGTAAFAIPPIFSCSSTAQFKHCP